MHRCKNPPPRFVPVLAVLGLIAADAALSSCASKAQPAPRERVAATAVWLDGETFDVELVPANQAPIDDRLTFRSGMLDSKVCSELGFPKAPYSARADGGKIEFTATSGNASMGRITWTGTVTGGRIDGTLVRRPADGGAASTSTFSGRR